MSKVSDFYPLPKIWVLSLCKSLLTQQKYQQLIALRFLLKNSVQKPAETTGDLI